MNKVWKFIGTFLFKLMVWIAVPLMIALLVLSIGLGYAEDKGWLFEPEKVDIVDIGNNNKEKSKEITKLEEDIKLDIQNTFEQYLNYKKMPNVLYATKSVVLMSYENDYFDQHLKKFTNEKRESLFNDYSKKFVGNDKVPTNNLKNSYTSFLNEVTALHAKENQLLQYLNGTNQINNKSLRTLKNQIVEHHIRLSEYYVNVVEDYHLWTHKRAYLPFYDETVLVVEEMKKKEETLSVGVASSVSLINYKNIFNELKNVEIKEIEYSLSHSLTEVNDSFTYHESFESYTKNIDKLNTEFKEKKASWTKLLANDKSFMKEETMKLISIYESYLNNRIKFNKEVLKYYQSEKENTTTYFDLFEKEILLTDEKAKVNLSFDDFSNTIVELEGDILIDNEVIK